MMISHDFARTCRQFSFLVIVALTAAACGSDAAPGDGGAGSGGTGGRGGTGGTADGGASCPTPQYTATTAFGAIFDGWIIGPNSTYTLVPAPGVDGGPATGTKLELDTTAGSPTNGSAKLTIPFLNTQEELLFAKLYAPGVNLSGTTVTAQIKLDSGLITGPTDQALAFIVLKSGPDYTWAPGNSITLDPTAGWVTLTLSADAPSPGIATTYTPCDIREIDIIIQTGTTGMYKEAVMHIDTIAIAPK
jgi:hypothetical protein